MHVGAVDQIADADRRADADIGEPLHMIDQVFAGEGLLRQDAFGQISGSRNGRACRPASASRSSR